MLNTVKLKDVCEFKRGLTYSKSDEVDYSGNIVVRATNIDLQNNKLNLTQLKYIKESIKINEDKILKKGDILICTASGSKSHLGKVALIHKDIKMAFGGFMGVLRTSEKCLPKFLYNILISQKFKKVLLSNTSGANINNLRFSQIENFEFILPALQEQRSIVAKLDAAFAEIDKEIAIKNKKINNITSLNQKIIDNHFLGFKEKILLDKIVLSKGTGLERSSRLQSIDKTYPYLKMNNISKDNQIIIEKFVSVDANKEEIEKYSLKKDDFLFNTRIMQHE
jgi:type I restriction enzyme S subunit